MNKKHVTHWFWSLQTEDLIKDWIFIMFMPLRHFLTNYLRNTTVYFEVEAVHSFRVSEYSP